MFFLQSFSLKLQLIEMKKLIFTTLILHTFLAFSQQNTFHKRLFIHNSDTLKYQLSFPDNYNNKTDFPLVIFLHGSGERGSDNEKQLIHGSKLFNDPINRIKYPAVVIFPQCPQESYWVKVSRENSGFNFSKNEKISEPLLMVERLIQDIVKKENIDSKRIYLMGLSMGGMGTLDLICRNPNLFAAAIPICGGVEISRIRKVKNLPIRLYHGAKDDLVPPSWSRNIFKELKTIGSTKVEYIEFENANHNSWDPAFESDDFLEWIFNNKKD